MVPEQTKKPASIEKEKYKIRANFGCLCFILWKNQFQNNEKLDSKEKFKEKNEIIRGKTLSDNFNSRQTKKNTLHKIWAKTSKQILLQLFEKLRREGCHQRNNAFEQYAEWKQHLYISCKISDIFHFEDKIYLSWFLSIVY